MRLSIWNSVGVMVAAAVLVGLAAATAAGQELGKRFSLEELNQMVTDAKVVVRAKATAEPVAEGGNEEGLVLRIPLEVLEVVKGTLTEKTVQLHIRTPVEDLNTPRKSVPNTEYVLPLAPLGAGQDANFKLAGGAGFVIGTAEADRVIEIARGGKVTGTLSPLRLQIKAARPPYESGKPAPIRVSIDNPSKETITYTQSPIEQREGDLYLPGFGRLDVADGRGNSVPPKEGLHEGKAAPDPAAPRVIAPERASEVELDLARYFDLSRPDNYLVTMAINCPDGKEALKSNTIGVQVIAPLAAGVEPTTPKPAATGPESIRVPSPEVYEPGEPVNGLAGLLKPLKAEYTVGEKMMLELRLINVSDQPLTVDCRLERTLLFKVQEQGNSPVVRSALQRFTWPEDDPKSKEQPFAFLRPLAFWGKLVNVNSLYGRNDESLLAEAQPTAQARELEYERYGMKLFSFDAPGVYKIQASYVVKPRSGEGPKIWTSQLNTNPIFVRVVAGKKPEAGPPNSSSAPAAKAPKH